MANLNFPSTTGQPTDGSFQYTDANNGVIYSWDGIKWEANSGSSLNTMYVQVAGDNMTGDRTLGTDKITWNTEGSAEFALDVNARSFLTSGMEYAGLGTAPGVKIRNTGDLAISGTGSCIQIFNNADGTVPSSATETFRLNNDGTVYIGGTIVALPNIKLNPDGKAAFANTLDVGTYSPTATDARGLRAYIDDNKLNLGIQCKSGQGGANDAFNVREGNALKYSIKYNGSATFSNAVFNLEADDDTKYTSTTDADGNETRVYNGTTLDVKDRLTKTDAALQSLKAALVTTTDHESLKAALIAALADI